MLKLLKIFFALILLLNFNMSFSQDTTGIEDVLQKGGKPVGTNRENIKSDAQIIKDNINTRIFGAELFATFSPTFQPNLKIATPANYVLGPDDQLVISVYGLQVGSFNLTVSPDGTINVPNVGEIVVSGYTIEEARVRIRSRMSSIYTSLRSGSSQLSINLGKIRSIRITVLGSYKAGTFTMSSLSTVMNALYVSGGPAENGSYREIELIRNSKIVKKIDLYNLLLSGSFADDERLRENDIIRIPVYKNRVEINGQVKRQGIFEMLPGETFNDLVRFASGFTDVAYKASVKVLQLTDTERKVKDLNAAEFSTYRPSTGDNFNVSQILDRYQNRVTIDGAVFRPGTFELTNNLTLSQLIKNADGLKEDAYLQRGQLIRLREDLTTEIIPFDVAQILNKTTDITLRKDDRIVISSFLEFRNQYNVSIQGEVRSPGAYPYSANLTLKDLLFQAKGFTDAAYPQRIEIARVIRRDTLTASDVRLSEIIDVRDMNDFALTSKNISLQPFDVVTVRRMPGYINQQSVTVSGQVQFPGPYVLSTRTERVSEVLKRAGGFSPEAYIEGSYLKRKNNNEITPIESQKIDKLQKQLKDSSGEIVAAVARPYDLIPLDIRKLINNPGTEPDLILKPGDELFVPRNDEQVKLSGELLFPTQVPYRKGKSLKEYINDGGGFTDNARRKRVYVLYPNGKAAATKRFLIFRSFPNVEPGSDIIVPSQLVRKKEKKDVTQVLGFASAVTALAGVIIAIANLIK